MELKIENRFFATQSTTLCIELQKLKKQTHRQMLTSTNVMIVLILFVTDINCSFKKIFIYLPRQVLVAACRLSLRHAGLVCPI